MNILVMKFGGSSVANIEKLKNVSSIIKKEINNILVFHTDQKFQKF